MADILLSSVHLLADQLPLLAKGKVRELYSLDDQRLLFVATDRISAYDVVMKNVSDHLGLALQTFPIAKLHWAYTTPRVSRRKADC